MIEKVKNMYFFAIKDGKTNGFHKKRLKKFLMAVLLSYENNISINCQYLLIYLYLTNILCEPF